MTIYLVIFTIIAILLSQINEKKNQSLFMISGISLLLLSFLAAFRDSDVGIDMKTYVVPYFEIACYSHSWSDYFTTMPSTELLYLILNYGVSRFSTDIHVFMFVHQMLLCFFLLLTIYRLRKYECTSFLCLFYVLYLYNDTYSLYRQSLAIMLYMVAFTYLMEKQYKKYYILLVISLLFHNSVIFAFLIHPMLYLYERFKDRNTILYIAIVAVLFFIYSSFTLLVNNAIADGLISSKYSTYADQEGFTTHKIDLAVLAAIMFLLYKYRHKLDSEWYGISFYLVFISFGITAMGGLVEVANRAAYYFFYPLCCVIVAASPYKYKRVNNIVLLLLLVRFFYLAYRTGIAGSIPYSSKILGI